MSRLTATPLRAGPRGGRLWRHRRRGQLLFVVVISIIGLVSLIFFTYNFSDHTNRRLEAQNTADAAAVSGAGWMARSYNVVAMNNVGMSKCLSLVPIMDAFPLSADMAYEETNAWEIALSAQIDRSFTEEASTRQYILQGLTSLRDRMAQQRDILRPIDYLLNETSFNMETQTHWSVRGQAGSPPHGKFWQAAVTLDEINQATMQSAGVLAQANTVRFSEDNSVETAFLVPLEHRPPVRRGELNDFQPTLQGRLRVSSDDMDYQPTGGNGGAIPDAMYPHRLGPWARLHRWRDEWRRSTGAVWVPGTPGYGKVRGWPGNKTGGRISGSSARTRQHGRSGHWRSTGSEVLGYTTYGPYNWALRHIHNWTRDWEYWDETGRQLRPGALPDTYFYQYHRNIASIKLGYMFGSKDLKRIHFPLWIVDYNQARTLGTDGNTRVTRTMYYLVEIASSVPKGSANWLRGGTFRTNGERPIAIWSNGWVDADSWGSEKIGEHVWRNEFTYETTGDPEIGLQPVDEDGDGQPDVWHTVYFYQWYIFGGIDVGGDVDVSNPCNWDEYDVLPAPILLDTTEGDYDPFMPDPDAGFRRAHFTYLAVVRKRNRAAIGPDMFSSGAPGARMYALAQAKVFNNLSFDLWTQDWQVQLMPVTHYEDWMARFEQSLVDVGNNPLLDPEKVAESFEYMSNLNADMMDRYLQK